MFGRNILFFQVLQEFRQPFALRTIQPVVEIAGKVCPQIKYLIRILRNDFIQLRQSRSVGFVEFLYKTWLQGFIADPCGEDEGKSGERLPGFSKIIDVRGYLSLLKGPV